MKGNRHWWWHRPFLYIGRMSKDKGVTTIIRAWKALNTQYPRSCPPLWLTGGSPEEIEEIRTTAGLIGEIDPIEQTGQIQWWGYLDSAGISALLTRTSVLIMHSRYEPGGRVVIEAMAQGVPVIATPNGFAKDLIKNWYNGFLVNFGDEGTLVHRMAHFLHQPLLRNALGAAAQATIHRTINQWNFLDTHCYIYDQVASSAYGNLKTTKEQKSNNPYNYYRRRRILPTYPYTSQEPDLKTIRDFAEQHIDCEITNICKVEDGPGSSMRWLLTGGEKKWVVKWPYPRLVLRVLWDTIFENQLITSAEERFKHELFSAKLPCFAPWTAYDANSLLLLRPILPQQNVTVNPDIFIELAARYKELQDFPLPSFSWAAELERNWNSTSLEEIIKIREVIRSELATTDWDPYRQVSLRLAWREIELAFERDKFLLKKNKIEQFHLGISIFRQLAEAETGLSLCVSHGSGDLCHCLRSSDGRLLFIDGEHVHPAQPGEDIAASIWCAIEDLGEIERENQLWPELIDVVANDKKEKKLILAWAGLFAFDEIRKQATILQNNYFQLATSRWETLMQLAQNQLSQ